MNAVKFSPGGERIPPQHRAKIFERFYQAHGSSHRSGLGLGLYVARQIVELHGGKITVAFAPSGGSTFTLDLPSARAAAAMTALAS